MARPVSIYSGGSFKGSATGIPMRAMLLLLALQLLIAGCATSTSSGTPAAVPIPPSAPTVKPTPAVQPPRAAPPSAGPPVTPGPPPPAPNAVTGSGARGASAVLVLGSASAALLSTSKQHAQQGNLDAAAADIERALSIEPAQPRLWLELGEVRLLQRRKAQARAAAQRAQSLLGSDSALAERAANLLARAAE